MAGIDCPHCPSAELVILSEFNRGGSLKMQCKPCRKTFTPSPNSQAMTHFKEQMLGFCLGDRKRQMLQIIRDALPQDWRNKPVKTDHLATYA